MTEGPLVLIVDDEADFLEIFSIKLKSAGFRVEIAHDGEEGIRKAKALKPDLMLLDMRMPRLSGADVMLALRDDPEMKGVKIVFLSSVGDPREKLYEVNRRFAKEIGAHDYLKKVDDLDALVDHVRALLG